MAKYNPYNRLLVVPFRDRLLVKQRIDRGESIFGGSELAYIPPGNSWKEVAAAPPKDEIDRAFEFLELKRKDATKKMIQQAVRKLAAVYHPDKGGKVEDFHRLIWARDLTLKEVRLQMNNHC